jgi:hypothetical protein
MLLLAFPPNMTCWWGWYTVYWAEASPTLDISKERTGMIYMARKGAREIPRDERAALELKGSRGGGTRCVVFFPIPQYNTNIS